MCVQKESGTITRRKIRFWFHLICSAFHLNNRSHLSSCQFWKMMSESSRQIFLLHEQVRFHAETFSPWLYSDGPWSICFLSLNQRPSLSDPVHSPVAQIFLQRGMPVSKNSVRHCSSACQKCWKMKKTDFHMFTASHLDRFWSSLKLNKRYLLTKMQKIYLLNCQIEQNLTSLDFCLQTLFSVSFLNMVWCPSVLYASYSISPSASKR